MCWLARWLTGWLARWLAGWVDGKVVGWLAGWLAGRNPPPLTQSDFFTSRLREENCPLVNRRIIFWSTLAIQIPLWVPVGRGIPSASCYAMGPRALQGCSLALDESDGAEWVDSKRADPRTRATHTCAYKICGLESTACQPPNFDAADLELCSEQFRWSAFPVFEYLERLLGWFNRSQSASEEGTFGWRGRKGYHLLPCGLDNYPRSDYATAAAKHVDLYSWAPLVGSTIHTIGEAIREESKNKQHAASLRDKLDGRTCPKNISPVHYPCHNCSVTETVLPRSHKYQRRIWGPCEHYF